MSTPLPPSPPAPGTMAEDGAKTVRFEFTLKSMFSVLALLAGVWLALHALPALLILVTALILIGALQPIVAWFEQRKLSRLKAVCLVFGLGAVVTVTLIALTVPTLIAQVKTLADNEPKIRETIASYLERTRFTASMAGDIRQAHYMDLLKSAQTPLFDLSTRALELAAGSVAAVFLAFYMMLDHDRLQGALFAVVPRRHHIRLSRILLNLATIVGGYIRGQVLTCALMGAFILVLLLVCRVPNALAIAVFGSVMDLLPYIGIFLTMAPAVLAATVKGPAIATIVFVLMLAYEEIESRVLVPVVYGRALRLPSSAVFFALIMGGTVAGIVGALLALPLAAAVLMLIDELRIELPGETIQPEDLAQRREDDRSEQEYVRRAESMPADQAAVIAVEISGNRKKEEGEAEKAQLAAEELSETQR